MQDINEQYQSYVEWYKETSDKQKSFYGKMKSFETYKELMRIPNYLSKHFPDREYFRDGMEKCVWEEED